jgi:hypothetical protein
LVPVGCVEAYEKAMTILVDISKYPALAETEMRDMERCIPRQSAAWTIVGYIDSSGNAAISAELAGLYLDRIKIKRTTDPVVDVSYR